MRTHALLLLLLPKLRSMYVTIQTTSVGPSPPQNGLYLVLLVCAAQAVEMFWLTRHLIN